MNPTNFHIQFTLFFILFYHNMRLFFRFLIFNFVAYSDIIVLKTKQNLM